MSRWFARDMIDMLFCFGFDTDGLRSYRRNSWIDEWTSAYCAGDGLVHG